ncbi:MAG: NUDIX hydrolase [Anaerolineales bacterium]
MDFEPLQRRTVFHGRAFDVEQVELKLPNNTTALYDLVSHKNAITIVPLDAGGNILFVRQYRLGASGYLLELPAGVLEEGEDPLEGARREIREETGFAAGEWIRLGEFYMAPGYSSELMHVFLARQLCQNPLSPDKDEFIGVETIPIAQAYEMARTGQIRDGKSLSSLFLAQTYLLP